MYVYEDAYYSITPKWPAARSRKRFKSWMKKTKTVCLQFPLVELKSYDPNDVDDHLYQTPQSTCLTMHYAL